MLFISEFTSFPFSSPPTTTTTPGEHLTRCRPWGSGTVQLRATSALSVLGRLPMGGDQTTPGTDASQKDSKKAGVRILTVICTTGQGQRQRSQWEGHMGRAGVHPRSPRLLEHGLLPTGHAKLRVQGSCGARAMGMIDITVLWVDSVSSRPSLDFELRSCCAQSPPGRTSTLPSAYSAGLGSGSSGASLLAVPLHS